ncbi:MAG: FtsW/RodA/SpoVE family cell cycle protein, partial [Pseudomonadota bacterium]
MSYLEYKVQTVPTGFRKILHMNWALLLLLTAVSSVGFLMLTSVAGGNFGLWAEPQMQRFALGVMLMLIIGMVPLWFWRSMSGLAYLFGMFLLIMVELFGEVRGGAQRWSASETRPRTPPSTTAKAPSS